jgi:hypothetical protein
MSGWLFRFPKQQCVQNAPWYPHPRYQTMAVTPAAQLATAVVVVVVPTVVDLMVEVELVVLVESVS